MGIDLGTSFAAAAVAHAGGLDMVHLGGQAVVVPAVAFLDAGGTLRTGEPADRLGLDAPDRTAREFKRRLGDPTPLVLGGVPHSPTALMAAMLRDVLAGVRKDQHDEPPQQIVLTHPAVWGPYRREQFAAIPDLAGLSGAAVRLMTEPVAAATYYCSAHPLPPDGLLAVYDLGGGTFDSAVVRNGTHELEIVGTPEGIEWLGGADFDQAVLDHVDRALGGAVSRLDPADPGTSAILAALQRQCMLAKEALSTRELSSITVQLPGAVQQVELARADFERMITPALESTVEAFRRTLSGAGLMPQDLTAVLLVGGSSQIPLVSTLLRDALRRPIRINTHPKHAVALGAALLSSRAPSARPVSPPAAPPTNAPLSPPPPPPPPPPPVLVPAHPAPQLQSGPPPEPQLEPRPEPVAGSAPGPRRRLSARLRGRAGQFALVAVTAVVSATAVVLLTQPGGTGTPSGQAQGRQEPTGANATAAPASAASTASTSASAGPAGPAVTDPLVMFGGAPNATYPLFVSSAEDGWLGKAFGLDTASAGTSVTLRLGGGQGLRARFSGTAPGQLYFQAPRTTDVRPYGGAGTALVVDLTLHTQPADRVTIGVHCRYPCATQVDATQLVRALPVEQRSTIRVPLACFVADGLDLANVDTFFLLGTGGTLDVSLFDVRWVPGAANTPGTPACDTLR
ncbi:Hsp70 family protein [Dactylosporangium sp. NPDC050688]|uniref:Hsp70 family protein n=1 Tax=Dactylosporangium sp. NPDC050688 TaxID=3157217 RepID=UPI0033FB9A98